MAGRRIYQDSKLKRLEDIGVLIGPRAVHMSKVQLPKLNQMYILASRSLIQMTPSSKDLRPNLIQIELIPLPTL